MSVLQIKDYIKHQETDIDINELVEMELNNSGIDEFIENFIVDE